MSTTKSSHLQNLLLLNLATLLMSSSGTLGRFITLAPPVTIWWRCVLTALIIYGFCKFQKIRLIPDAPGKLIPVLVSGLFLGAHWITYFYSLQYSNVAIAMLSLYTFPMVTSVLEPIFFKEKFRKDNIIMGLVVVFAVYFLVPEFDFENTYTQGLLFGLISSLFVSIRNLLLKGRAQTIHGSAIMFHQLVIIAIVSFPVMFVYSEVSITGQWETILALVIITTALGHTLFVISLKHFSVSVASIISSLQPVFGIIFAMLFLQEYPSMRSIIGGVLILSTVVFASLRDMKRKS